MVRRIVRPHDNSIIAICPSCKTGSNLRRAFPQIDSCGFESYHFQCQSCKSYLAGIIDPINQELLVSLLEPTNRYEHSLTGKDGYQTEAITRCAEKFVLMMLISKRRS